MNGQSRVKDRVPRLVQGQYKTLSLGLGRVVMRWCVGAGTRPVEQGAGHGPQVGPLLLHTFTIHRFWYFCNTSPPATPSRWKISVISPSHSPPTWKVLISSGNSSSSKRVGGLTILSSFVSALFSSFSIVSISPVYISGSVSTAHCHCIMFQPKLNITIRLEDFLLTLFR